MESPRSIDAWMRSMERRLNQMQRHRHPIPEIPPPYVPPTPPTVIPNQPIYPVSNTTTRSVLAASLPAVVGVPLFVWRTSASAGRELEVTLDAGSTWSVYALSKPPVTTTYLSSLTWLKPAGAAFVQVRLVGGGGAGGGGPGGTPGTNQAGGGGGGGYCELLSDASGIPQSVIIVVGVGAGGGSGAGNTGGDSSWASMQGDGGLGGAVAPAVTTGASAASGGAGGNAAGGNVKNVSGGPGGLGRTLAGTTTGVAFGGPSYLAPIVNSSLSSAVNGPNGELYGGGGAGAFISSTTRNGGNGANGCVVVTVYY